MYRSLLWQQLQRNYTPVFQDALWNDFLQMLENHGFNKWIRLYITQLKYMTLLSFQSSTYDAMILNQYLLVNPSNHIYLLHTFSLLYRFQVLAKLSSSQ